MFVIKMRSLRCSSCLIARSSTFVLENCSKSSPRARFISSSASTLATPLPHPAAPGPPPKVPTPSESFSDDRVSRKKKLAELLKGGQTLRVNPAKPSTALKKRFWNDVSILEAEDGLQIFLDKRPVRTASKHVLTIPRNKPQLAAAIAIEWDLLVSAQQALKQHYIPLTSLASRATDIKQADLQGETRIRDNIVKMLVEYLNTDTLLCWAPEHSLHDAFEKNQPPKDSYQSLRDLQIQTAQPILDYLSERVWPGIELNPSLDADSILPKPQSQETISKIKEWIRGLPPYELAGLERGVLATKSLLVGVRLLVEWSQEFAKPTTESTRENPPLKFTIEAAAEASDLEVAWQTKMWGEVEDTHDVNKEDLKRQLGSVVLLVHGSIDENS